MNEKQAFVVLTDHARPAYPRPAFRGSEGLRIASPPGMRRSDRAGQEGRATTTEQNS